MIKAKVFKTADNVNLEVQLNKLFAASGFKKILSTNQSVYRSCGEGFIVFTIIYEEI